MSESTMIVLLVSGVSCWLIGGTWWRQAKVIVFPLIVALFLGGIRGWLAALTIGVANSMPYGDASRWPMRLLTFFCIGLPGVWFDARVGFWYALGVMAALAMVEWFSRRYNRVTHKLWESFAGLLQAAGIVLSVLR